MSRSVLILWDSPGDDTSQGHTNKSAFESHVWKLIDRLEVCHYELFTYDQRYSTEIVESDSSNCIVPANASKTKGKSSEDRATTSHESSAAVEIPRLFDIILDFRDSNYSHGKESCWLQAYSLMSSSGFMMLRRDLRGHPLHGGYYRNNWRWIDQSNKQSSAYCFMQLRDVTINESGCPYWTNHPLYDLQREYEYLDKITLKLTQKERELGLFSDASHKQAIDSLNAFGLCVLPGIFDVNHVRRWGNAVRSDMRDALHALLKQGIDLTKPGIGPRIENYYELSMREAYRFDLRNGRNVQQLSQSINQNNPSKLLTSEIPWHINTHPAIRKILVEVMNPFEGEHSRGNWGLWNFDGLGPEAAIDPRNRQITVGHIGAVISLPGCVDQTIHADAAHIYTPSHLPGHYYNLFLPASELSTIQDHRYIDPDYKLGQTAFILSSHKLEISAKTMADGDQKLLESLLVRPHLSLGDALIFDCRILHFGLANQIAVSNPEAPLNSVGESDMDRHGMGSHDIDAINPRVMIYINHHQPWFHDPKNWNNREKLFPRDSKEESS